MITVTVAVSDESFYFQVYLNKAASGDLYTNLRRQKLVRKRHLSGCDKRSQIFHCRTISERTSNILARKQVGHSEGNTAIGSTHEQNIVILIERMSGFAVLANVSNMSADLVGRAIETKFKPLNSQVRALKVANGKEFTDHQETNQIHGIKTNFADPYCSWQRGSNENFNRLPRQYIPKKRRIKTVSEDELTMIENSLNQRPRKRQGFIRLY